MPLSSNLLERYLRDMELGRKNHYGSMSLRSTELVALFYWLLETACLCGEDAGRYLLRTALAAIGNPSTVMLPSSHD